MPTELFVYTIKDVACTFEWDTDKRLSNALKHGIDFPAVLEIFQRPIVEMPDIRPDYGEDRWIIFGIREDGVLVVIIVYRGETRRIISARKGSSHEEEIYYSKRPH